MGAGGRPVPFAWRLYTLCVETLRQSLGVVSNIEWKMHRLTGGYRPSRRRVRRVAGEFEVAFDDGTAEVRRAGTGVAVISAPPCTLCIKLPLENSLENDY